MGSGWHTARKIQNVEAWCGVVFLHNHALKKKQLSFKMLNEKCETCVASSHVRTLRDGDKYEKMFTCVTERRGHHY